MQRRDTMNLAITAAALLSAWSATATASCGSAFCSATSSWDTLSAQAWQAGDWRLDYRFEFIDQDKLYSGSAEASAMEAAAQHHEEQRTLNRNSRFEFDYALDSRWGISAILPLLNRDHHHIHHHHGVPLPDSWSFNRIGDLQINARYQVEPAPLSPDSMALQAGLKLPTGSHDLSNEDGDVAERSLQPGSGTTDLIMGGSYSYRPADSSHLWFVQGSLQVPLNEIDDYRPGKRLLLSAGVQLNAGARVNWLLQLNGQWQDHDQGAEAEPEESGLRALYVSPGVSVSLNKRLRAYGMVQQPLYQRVEGLQLVADHAFVIGLSLSR